MTLEGVGTGWRSLAEGGVVAEAPGRTVARRRPQRVGERLSTEGVIGVALIAAVVAVAILGPLVIGANPARQDLAGRLTPPLGFGGGTGHPLGTDSLGRDLLARVVAGARVSLLIGVTATLVAGAVGVALGLVAGYAGGVVDRVIGGIVEVQMAIPFVVVAIAVTATLGPGLGNVLLTLVLTGWVGYARVVRLQARAIRGAPWVEAARSLGAGFGGVLGRHILPNLTGPILVLGSQQVAAMILYEAALSYLGLGVGGDVVTWGGMIADGRETLLSAWWVATVPGVVLAATILGLNLIGDSLAGRRQG
jgi:peptide/nickel transport system permease protein